MIDRAFWQGRRVLLTGHSGFKGGWLATWLIDMGSKVIGLALPPETEPSYFALCHLGERMTSILGDIRDPEVVAEVLRDAQPEVVFHFAAQSLVRRSYREPVGTFETNVMGTLQLLEALRSCPSVRSIVVATSDKCYRNQETGRPFEEDDALGGKDPYSASKAATELAVDAYRSSFFAPDVGLATVRAGNVIGGGDFSEDRLVPDALRAARARTKLRLRNPTSVRPWQHVLDPLSGYIRLAERLFREPEHYAGAWNFGPDMRSSVSVGALADLMVKSYPELSWDAEPQPGALAEAGVLLLSSRKAKERLGWESRLTLEDAVAWTLSWYRQALEGSHAQAPFQHTVEQIRSFEAR